jgi:hypothetical protein
MYESIMLSPKSDHMSNLTVKMKEHNQTFHKEGSASSMVWRIINGPNTGKLIWMMGPVTFTEMDEMEMGADHMKHWVDDIMPNLHGMEQAEFWRLNGELSNQLGKQSEMIYVRFLKINNGQLHNLIPMLKMVADVRKKNDPDVQFGVYVNEFMQGDIGRHVAVVTSMDGWADLDQEDTFQADFEEHFGSGSWDSFLRNWETTFADMYDEIWTLMPEMMASTDN